MGNTGERSSDPLYTLPLEEPLRAAGRARSIATHHIMSNDVHTPAGTHDCASYLHIIPASILTTKGLHDYYYYYYEPTLVLR